MYYITVSNGLLQGDHQKKMGSSVWQFMWCLDKLTVIKENGEGKVLGGKPIQLKDIQGASERTISRNLNKLEKLGYLKLIHTPYGISILVYKAKKIFGGGVDKSGVPKRSDKSGVPLTKFGVPNKTIQLDNTTKTTAFSKEKDGEALKVNKKTMKQYQEPSIDLETGEYTTKEEPKRLKAINYIKGYFIEKCEIETKVKPILTYKQNIIIANLFKKGMKPDYLTDVIDWWFETEQDKAKAVHINLCLSAWNLTNYNASKVL